MRSFKKVLIFIAVVLAYEAVLDFLLEPVVYEHFLEKELTRDAKQGLEPDMVFIGDSGVEMTFVPSVIENELEDVDCVLNAGTGSQMIWGSYYYLKDLLREYDMKYAVVGIDYSVFMKQEERVPKRDLVVLSRIKSPFIKAEYAGKFLQGEEYLYLIKSFANKGNLGSIRENVRAKLSHNYRLGIDDREDACYMERGYVCTTARGELRTGIYGPFTWETGNISEEAVLYLDKIVELCREEQVTLYLAVTPIAFSSLYDTATYQEMLDYFQDYAVQKGVFFCDLNLMKDRVRVLPDSMMSDGTHVGGEGAGLCSMFYGKILREKGEGKDVSEYFYASAEEMRQDIRGVEACSFGTVPFGEEGDRMIQAKSIHGEGVVPEYEYWVCEESGQWTRLQEYSESTQCLLPAGYLNGKVIIQVNCRTKGENVNWEQRTQAVREPGME